MLEAPAVAGVSVKEVKNTGGSAGFVFAAVQPG
jgi:hypothetical protein